MTPAARHVVIATRIFEPEGGAAAYRLGALARALRASGAAVTVLTTRPPDGTRSAERVRRWPVLRDRAGAVRGYVQYASFDIPLLARLFAARRPDAIVVEPPPTTGVVVRIAGRLRRIPYVYFAADVSSSAAAGIGVHPAVVSVLRAVERWVLRGAARILAVSEGVRDEIVALGIDPRRIRVVGTGVDTTVFTPEGPVVGDDAPTLVYAGTMSEIQGAGVFIDAFEQIGDDYPDARLVMLGAGTESAELSARASQNPRVVFPGTLPGDRTAARLRGAVAGLASVRPGRGYDFAFATKAFASIACGTPVLYAGVGPAGGRIAENGLGWTVPWDADEVARVMRSALDAPRDENERRRLAAWTEEHHSLHAVSLNAVAAIDEVLR